MYFQTFRILHHKDTKVFVENVLFLLDYGVKAEGKLKIKSIKRGLHDV